MQINYKDGKITNKDVMDTIDLINEVLNNRYGYNKDSGRWTITENGRTIISEGKNSEIYCYFHGINIGIQFGANLL